MSQRALIPFHAVLAFTFISGFALPAAAVTDARVSEAYGKLPLQFEANRGQTDKDVRFLSRGPGYSLYLTAGEAVLVLSKPNADVKRDAHGAKTQERSFALRMSLVGAARKPQVTGIDELPGKANYFIGKDRSKWRANVPTYAKVRYQNVYPGIDLVYYGNQRQLEYDFVVAPGADPKKIVLGFRGAKRLEIDAEGELVLHTAGGDIRQHKPVIYQEVDGVRRKIDGSYVREGANQVGFQVAAYDASRPLVIDPVLSYSSFLGGSSFDSGASIAVDATGAAYVTGATLSTDFPTTAGAFDTGHNGSFDAFVIKLNAAGSALVYSTFLGGSGFDQGLGIAVDATGAAYVTGGTSSPNFPTTVGAFDTSCNGNRCLHSDAFVAKLDATGSVLVYSTFLGGSDDDQGVGIALDMNGAAYVSGTTRSTDFPITAAAFDTSFNGIQDAFVTKLDAKGSALIYSTFLGGNSVERGGGIAVDATGAAYATGTTQSIDFPITAGAFDTTHNGGEDVFVTKLNAAGTALVYSTFLGGSGLEGGAGIALDGTGAAYIIGGTTSPDFPTTAGAFDTSFNDIGGSFSDVFVTKLDATGSALIYSTFLGGSAFDAGTAIAVDGTGAAYLTGITQSTDFPTTAGAVDTSLNGSFDAFVIKLDAAGSTLVFSTFLGGSGNDQGFGVALDSAGGVYVTGSTESADFPTTAGAFDPNFNGSPDAFVAKIVEVTRSEESAATQIGFWTNYGAETGTFSGGMIVASNVIASTAMFSFTGTAVSWIGVKCNVCGIAAVSVDGGAPTTVNTAGPNAPGSLNSESVFSASGLAAGNHTLTIAVTGMSSSGGSYVALDAFDVTAGSGNSPLLPPVVLPPPPVVVPPLPPIVGL